MNVQAPGSPGIEPRWTSSAKEAVGTARTSASPLWFTLSHGIVNEIYYPRIDQACIRDAEFLVVTPGGRFVEEKRHGIHRIAQTEPSVPAFVVETEDPDGEFSIIKRFVSDPARPTLLVDVSFSAGDARAYTLVFLLAPHIDNHGYGNTAWVGDYKGTPVVYATRESTTLAVAASAPLLASTVGFVGVSDAWQELQRSGALEDRWDRADDGNVALAVQPDLEEGDFTIAVGFGSNPAEAGQRAIGSLRDGFETCLSGYAREWRAWNRKTRLHVQGRDHLARSSALVLGAHQAKSFSGGLIASLSIPWGFARGDGDLGGYHLIWPRDHCEAAGALFAIGAHEDGVRALSYLRATQEQDGHWAQNMWLDGTAYWGGIQMDETALPVLLVDLARSVGALSAEEVLTGFWPMVRAAASYIVANGPVTAQDRWEEDGGYSPFTLATEIAALLTAAELADEAGEDGVAQYLRETVDSWDAHIETWCYVSGTRFAESIGVDGYYVRIGPSDESGNATPLDGWVPIKNRPPGQDLLPARSVVSPDAIALVRFGIRAADDPRITSTIRAIDATLRTEFDFGPGWRRYNDDGYGEHPDGSPFDGSGQGRVWPLLTGERAHFEIAAGRLDRAQDLAATLRAMAGQRNLLPEQIWDAPDIEALELRYGRPTGSAMPLVWAHAEYLKLLRSLSDEKIFDLPGPVHRHRADAVAARRRFWRTNHKISQIDEGSKLRIELRAPASIHWSTDGWTTARDTATVDTGIGMHVADLDTSSLPTGSEIVFTIKGPDGWEQSERRMMVLGGR